MCFLSLFMLTYCFATEVVSILSMRCLWTLHTTTQLSLFCVKLLLSHVFRHLRALNERSASQEDTGQTSNNLSNCPTCENKQCISDIWSNNCWSTREFLHNSDLGVIIDYFYSKTWPMNHWIQTFYCICCIYFLHKFYILFRVNIYLFIVSPFLFPFLTGLPSPLVPSGL